MTSELERYGAGSGIPLGLGVTATAATLAGVQSEFALVAAFGASGGLVVGGFAGRFADSHLPRENGVYRVVTFTLFVSLLVGGALGVLTAWTVTATLLDGVLSGAATGGVFSLLLAGVLVTKGRQSGQTVSPNE